ncbi:MAG: hypothetical protein SGJ10_02545, partial [Bacteroidota bacterium]|nr:hypothetical protein [Bacteroidota bacterium]
YIYIYTGPILAVCKATRTTFETNFWGSRIWEHVEVMTRNIAIGIKSGIGYEFKVNSKGFVFAELQNNALTYRPSKLELRETYPGNSKTTAYYHKTVSTANPQNIIKLPYPLTVLEYCLATEQRYNKKTI